MRTEPTKLPAIAVVAVVFALLEAVMVEVSSILQPFALVIALIPVWAGVGVLCKRAGTAYGFALYQFASLISLPLLSTSDYKIASAKLILVFLFNSFTSVLFFLTGRALQHGFGKKGFLTPWLVLSLLATLPFIFLHPYVLPTGSMENTLLVGDRLLVRVFPRASVRDGDIVVFHYPSDRTQIFVKRVVGQAGDRIRMVSRVVYRNGTKLAEPYVMPPARMADFSRDNFPLSLSETTNTTDQPSQAALREMLTNHVLQGELIVPKHKYFVLGDNRDNSLDSRYWGLLDESDVVGKPVVVYYSEVTPQGKRLAMPKLRWDRFMKFL